MLDAPFPFFMTTYLKTEAREPFLTLLEDLDLREVVASEGKSLDDEAPPCTTPPARPDGP